MIEDDGVVAGNVTDKYKTRNPIMRYMMDNFLSNLKFLCEHSDAKTVLEVGCGEGELYPAIAKPLGMQYTGTDISEKIIAEAKSRHPDVDFDVQSATELTFEDNAFDLVIAAEVLEHLPDPLAGLNEIARVTKRYAILSVPREPLWRGLNMARGAYVKEFGNTPGHLQHWSRSGFERFVKQRFDIRVIRCPLPWTMVMAEKVGD